MTITYIVSNKRLKLIYKYMINQLIDRLIGPRWKDIWLYCLNNIFKGRNILIKRMAPFPYFCFRFIKAIQHADDIWRHCSIPLLISLWQKEINKSRLIEKSCKKCGKWRSLSPFATLFSKVVCRRCVRMRLEMGKSWNIFISIFIWRKCVDKSHWNPNRVLRYIKRSEVKVGF